MSIVTPPEREIVYPDSDGEPMAENTLQFEWIVTIKEGTEAVFRDDPNVFVAGDLLWYPVEGQPLIRMTPDTMIAFGRPKGYRGPYLQWLEGDIAPQVTFEVMSPGNRAGKMIKKFQFYEKYGVEEYYLYDPDDGALNGWLRNNGQLLEIPEMMGWVSPRLGVRFGLKGKDLQLFGPDGRPYSSYLDLVRQRESAEREAKRMQRLLDTERRQAETERQRAERLAAQLRALGVNPDLDRETKGDGP